MDGNQWYGCLHCQTETGDFAEIIDHNIIYHADLQLKIKTVSNSTMKQKNFQIIPKDLMNDGKLIIPNKSTISLKISRSPEVCLTPMQEEKRFKLHVPSQQTSFDIAENLNSVCKNVQNMSFEDDISRENDNLQILLEESSDSVYVNELHSLLPSVISTLKDAGEIDTYIKFNRLLSENKLPMKNIAFLLFKDVISWYSVDDTHQMRYSDEVKQFWKVGLKLFKGRFLRFMSGIKNQCQDPQRHLNPIDSHINFAVPDRKILDETEICSTLKNVQPGIITEMIETIRKDDEFQTKTYKVCFDGKRLNAAVDGQKRGDVNLWGHEGPPSLQERERRLNHDLECTSLLEKVALAIDIRNITSITDATEDHKMTVLSEGKTILTVIGHRLADLRQLKQKKEITLEKLVKACISPQMKSKYSYAISAVRTFTYRIGVCIDKLINLVDRLGYLLSVINEESSLYCRGKICDLANQENYICLTGVNKTSVSREEALSINTSLVKQRTSAWQSVRSYARVTGSTCFDAIGLRSLKRQKEHFDYVFCGIQKPEPTSTVKKYMQHGCDNEINCVATLCSKVLPVFYPSKSYVEEGCEIIVHEDTPMLIVSPDGSIRSTDVPSSIRPGLAVEIKCPYPGNVYKPKVYYDLPYYYVPQILSEMAVLQTNSIVFLCYSMETTTVFEADFDPDLWNLIMTKILSLFEKSDSKCPSKIAPDIKQMQEKLRKYCKERVRFIAEVPSVIAKSCDHEGVSHQTNEGKYNYHRSSHVSTNEQCTVLDLQKLVYEIAESIKEASGLTRHMASEVLVYLLSDLDRTHTPERQHSVPIGYAMKGYSMTTDVMRNVVSDILTECYQRGLYVPIISFDGQWYKMAVRSADDKPLTLLQLMKDVYKNAKSMKKGDIIKLIKEVNVVKSASLEDLVEQIECIIEGKAHIVCGKDGKLQENRTTIFHVWRKKSTPYLLKMSVTVFELLDKTRLRKDIEKTDAAERAKQDFLDNLPENIAGLIENDILENITDETNLTSNVSNAIVHQDISREMQGMFETESTYNHSQEKCSTTFIETEMRALDDQLQEEKDADADMIQEGHTIAGHVDMGTPFLQDEHFLKMLNQLRTDIKTKRPKWKTMASSEFKYSLGSLNEIKKSFYKIEVLTCLDSISDTLKDRKIKYSASWTKQKLSEFVFNLVNKPGALTTSQKRTRNMYSLKTLCSMVLSTFPKEVLNVIHAEHTFPAEESKWRCHTIFSPTTYIDGLNVNIQWYSKPEFVPERYMYLFSFLDCHHLLTNARVKCCSTGIEKAGIRKSAWIKVSNQCSREGKEIISKALVEDLVDKQRNAYAQKTFSKEVEDAMRQNGDISEANFCMLLRQWYEAEDEPGILAIERCRRRLALRDWLCDKIKIGQFPPPGTHINGIPMVMFEGLMTNIERRIQLFPFVKSNTYNVRSLGSLESENFFGEFQDLDPKGSGVMRPDDVSAAISTACQLTKARYDPDRVFLMQTSRAKVYPFRELENKSELTTNNNYIMPNRVTTIEPRDHVFDLPERAERKCPKRKTGEISKPGMPSRGAKPIREHHRCDETKILPHVRMGLTLTDL